MAMSQFSYGALESYRRRGEPLPVPGGFDAEGELTRDAAAIEASGRALPIGFWKGSGLALLMDLVAAMLAQGRGTHDIPADPYAETGISQIFLAIDPAALGDPARADAIADGIIDHFLGSPEDGDVHYPGQRTRETRRQNLAAGIPVDPEIWAEILAM
jgi:3-dehydro-L-gulonate 2-dehydrogenase